MQFKIGKTVFHIGFPFAAVLSLMLLLDESATAITALICCILHETGHLLCLFAMSAPPDRVELGAFGMRIEKSAAPLSYKEETAAALAGPAVNFVLALIFFVLCRARNADYLSGAVALNLCAGIFNMIPVEPLDGGRALKNALLIRFDEQRTEKIIDIVSLVTLIPLTLCGIAVLKNSGYNFTLLLVCVYIAAYLLMKNKKIKKRS